jgi:SAM-dependent methyltransferase
MTDNHYDETLAGLYDDSPLLSEPDDHPSIDYFRRLADKQGGPVLQIGVANGRFALPIARDGHEIVGVDLSESMLGKLRNRTAGEPPDVRARLRLCVGDMRTLDLGQEFRLVMLPGNVFLYNLTQRDQLATLNALRRHLAPGGVLAIDIFTVDRELLVATYPTIASWHYRGRDGQEYLAEQTTLFDPLNQLETLRMVHRRIGTDGRLDAGVFTELTMRYVYPAEMLLLVRAAGMQVREFSGDYFSGAPKTAYDGPQLIVAETAGTNRSRK